MLFYFTKEGSNLSAVQAELLECDYLTPALEYSVNEGRKCRTLREYY